jgi:GT2 family glycosyltransferase
MLRDKIVPDRVPEFAPPVAIILVNFNGWQDTIECMEACLKLKYPRFKIIVSDNASEDGSIDRLIAWSNGDQAIPFTSKVGQELAMPPTNKPIAVELLRDGCAARNRSFNELAPITLIELKRNAGFGAGNNAGIKLAYECGAEYFWLLNNDTVPDPDALEGLVTRCLTEPSVGLCGSLVAFYDQPETLQLAGGCSYYPTIGLARRIAGDMPRRASPNQQIVEAKLDYVFGASCLVTRPFIDKVGLMEEDYFLYCEEIDWRYRAKGKFRLAFSADSLVYHKAGRSIGSKSIKKERSPNSSYYLWRSRAMITRRYHKYGFPGLLLLGAAAILGELARGRINKARMIYRGMLGLSK